MNIILKQEKIWNSKTLSEPIKELEDCQNQIKSLERVIALKDDELGKKT